MTVTAGTGGSEDSAVTLSRGGSERLGGSTVTVIGGGGDPSVAAGELSLADGVPDGRPTEESEGKGGYTVIVIGPLRLVGLAKVEVLEKRTG